MSLSLNISLLIVFNSLLCQFFRIAANKPTLLKDGTKITLGAAGVFRFRGGGSGGTKRSAEDADDNENKRMKGDVVTASHILIKHKDSRNPKSRKVLCADPPDLP